MRHTQLSAAALMPEHVTCNLCGANDTRFLYSLRDYRFRVDDELWHLVQCRRCGLGYLNPRPTADEIGRYYPEAYFAHRGSMSRRYNSEARYVQACPGRTLLDIGAGRGDFLAVMRDRGWDVTGIEPWATTNPHGIKIHRERFPDERTLAEAQFDVVTAWAVFEHLHDPAEAFRRAIAMLRPGGRFILQVPNLRSIAGRFGRFEDIPRHLYVFAPSTIARYATLAGGELERVVHTTDLHGGSGRGVLRLALVQSIGGSVEEFLDFYRTPRRRRFARRPVLATAWTATAALERVLLSDLFVRTARLSGEIVAIIRRPPGRLAPTDGGRERRAAVKVNAS